MLSVQCLLVFVCFVATRGKSYHLKIKVGDVYFEANKSINYWPINQTVEFNYSYEDGEIIDISCYYPLRKLLILKYTSVEDGNVAVYGQSVVNFLKRMTCNNHMDYIDCLMQKSKSNYYIYRVFFKLKQDLTNYPRITIGDNYLEPTANSTSRTPNNLTATYMYQDGEIINFTCHYPGEYLLLKYIGSQEDYVEVKRWSVVNFLKRMAFDNDRNYFDCVTLYNTVPYKYRVIFRWNAIPQNKFTENNSSMTTTADKSFTESKDKHRDGVGAMTIVGCIIPIVITLTAISVIFIKRRNKSNTAVEAQKSYVETTMPLNPRPLENQDTNYENITSYPHTILNTNLFCEDMYAKPLKKSDREMNITPNREPMYAELS